MKKIISIFFLTISFITNGQVYTGTGGPILDNGVDTYFTLNIAGLNPAQIDSTFGLEQVCFEISHPAVLELNVYLQSPAGIIVQLALTNSKVGANFVNTCFSNQANSSITLDSPPYTGTFKPVGFLGRFNTGQAGNGAWKLIVHDGYLFNNAGSLISWNLTFGNSPAHPVIFKSSNLPIVFVNTSQPISDIKSTVTMGIINNGTNRNFVTNPWNAFNGKAQIHIRGNSTKIFEKKSFSLETHDASGNVLPGSLLGMPVESDWVLGASYTDKTLLRIPLTYDLFRAMGHYASRFKNVELIINNEYQGMYTFMEKLKRDTNRISIKKLDEFDNVFPSITGGYIMQIDRADEAGWYSKFAGNCPTNTKFYYQYIYPKDTDITIPQKNYIKSYLDSFETAMNSASFANPVDGYPKYIDVGSFIDYFIINEMSKNVDGYRLSTYLYKNNVTKGGKLNIGPVWDYDLAWHNCNYGNSANPVGWEFELQDTVYPSPTWWGRFMQDPVFVSKLYCRWKELRQNILSLNYLNNYIDSSANVIKEASERNFRQFPVIGAFIYANPQNQTGATYSTEVADLKSWIANRIAWLDTKILGTCSIGLKKEELSNTITVFPNPMESNTTFSLQLDKASDVTLCITDLLGREITRYKKTKMPQGDIEIKFERNQIQAGVYLYQLQINNAIKTGKLIIQ